MRSTPEPGKSLADLRPDIASEWHPTKNGELKPTDVKTGSGKKVWWKCQTCGHEWQSSVCSRSKQKWGCWKCFRKHLGKKQSTPKKGKSLADTHPDVAKEWHPTKNGELTPCDISAGSSKKIWWQCELGHEWWEYPYNRKKGLGCPFCSNQRVKVGFNDLATTHPELAAEWHPTKNGDLTPQSIVAGSLKKIWWMDSLGHEWNAPAVRRSKGGTGCPYCAGQKILVGFNDLGATNPDIASELHPDKNNGIMPSEVYYRSAKRMWWKCSLGHEWKTEVRSRTQDGNGCPFCSGNRILTGFNDLAKRHPDIAHEWHPTKNGKLRPDKIASTYNDDVWWMCDQGHEWKSTPASRTRMNSGCPICNGDRHSSFSEKAVLFYLMQAFDNAEENYKGVDGFIRSNELDVFIPSISKGVEYDGGNWHKNVERDIAKDNACIDAGIDVIRIRDDMCPDYDGPAHVIMRNGNADYESLDEAIVELLDYLGVDDDISVDTRRDSRDIHVLYRKSNIKNSLAVKFPVVAREWNYELNGELTPSQIRPHVAVEAWWNCPTCGKPYKALVRNRVVNNQYHSGCKECFAKDISNKRKAWFRAQKAQPGTQLDLSLGLD